MAPWKPQLSYAFAPILVAAGGVEFPPKEQRLLTLYKGGKTPAPILLLHLMDIDR